MEVILKSGKQSKKDLIINLLKLELIYKECTLDNVQPKCFSNEKDLTKRYSFNNLTSIEVKKSTKSVNEDWDYIPQMKKTINEVQKCLTVLENLKGDFEVKLQICWRMCGGLELDLYYVNN